MSAQPSQNKVLILCTGNSCRSQMAEGLVNHLLGDEWRAWSAGTRPAMRVHPLAIRAMAEIGIDISGGRPKTVETYVDREWDLVVTVCDSARESCPVFPHPVKHLHVSFPDPAAADGSETERLQIFRQVRDDIRDLLIGKLRSLSDEDLRG